MVRVQGNNTGRECMLRVKQGVRREGVREQHRETARVMVRV